MGGRIGIRREDKNRWERRVPLTPSVLRQLREEHGIESIIQPSTIRVYRMRSSRRSGRSFRKT